MGEFKLKMIILQSKIGQSFYYKEDKLLVTVYKGRVNMVAGLLYLNKLNTFYKNNEVKGSVVDVTQVYGSFIKGLPKLGHLYKKFNKRGLTCTAFVVSDDIIINNVVLKLKQITESNKLKTAIFKDRKEAEEWVKANYF